MPTIQIADKTTLDKVHSQFKKLGTFKNKRLYNQSKSVKVKNISNINLPYPFAYGSTVVLNNKIHMLGGGSSTTYRKFHYKWNDGGWVKVSTLPFNFYNGSAVVLNNEIHIMGGFDSNTFQLSHYKWNGTSWTSVSTLPYNFCYGSAVVLNNEIHILGSEDVNCCTYHYKWNGSSWTSVGTLPYPYCGGITFGNVNTIHILSSYVNTTHYRKHYVWNGSSWTSVSTLPYDCYDGSGVILNDEIHIFGGSNTLYSKLHYKWNGSSWTSVSTLVFPFGGGSASTINDDIYALGGVYNSRLFLRYYANTWGYLKTATISSTTKTFNIVDLYNLTSGNKIICNKDNVQVYQKDNIVDEIDDGYEIIGDGVTYVTSNRSDNLIYIIQ